MYNKIHDIIKDNKLSDSEKANDIKSLFDKKEKIFLNFLNNIEYKIESDCCHAILDPDDLCSNIDNIKKLIKN